MKTHPDRTVWSFAIEKHTVLVLQACMSGHSLLKPWWMKPGLENMGHYLVWTLTKTQKQTPFVYG